MPDTIYRVRVKIVRRRVGPIPPRYIAWVESNNGGYWSKAYNARAFGRSQISRQTRARAERSGRRLLRVIKRQDEIDADMGWEVQP